MAPSYARSCMWVGWWIMLSTCWAFYRQTSRLRRNSFKFLDSFPVFTQSKGIKKQISTAPLLWGQSEESISVGIDLGTTYSLISFVKEGKPLLIPIDGNTLFPSIVLFEKDENVIVGKDALKNYRDNPENTFHSVKRLIGRSLDDARISGDDKVFGKKKLCYIDSNTSNNTKSNSCGLFVPVLQKKLLPEEISAFVLKRLLQCAEDFLNVRKINNAVITVPAYFDFNQRKATENAGYLAGLKQVKLLKEPEAAAMAYGMLQTQPQLVLVIDLGGGTFDVSVLDVGAGFVEVIATSGDGHLGGDDFDLVLLNWVLEKSEYFHSDQAAILKSDGEFLRQLTEECIAAKIRLSFQKQTNIQFVDPLKNMQVSLPITRAQFDALSRPLLLRMLRPIREVAIMAGINLPGESGLLGVQHAHSISNQEISQEDYKLLSIMQEQRRKKANLKNKMNSIVEKEFKRIKRLSADNSLIRFPGGQNVDDVILVGGASRIPSVRQMIHTLTGINPKQTVSPDEAVCLGAGIMAGVLDGKVEGFNVLSPLQAAGVRLLAENKLVFKNTTNLINASTTSSTSRKGTRKH